MIPSWFMAGTPIGLIVLGYLLWQNQQTINRMIEALTSVASAMTKLAEKVEHLGDER